MLLDADLSSQLRSQRLRTVRPVSVDRFYKSSRVREHRVASSANSRIISSSGGIVLLDDARPQYCAMPCSTDDVRQQGAEVGDEGGVLILLRRRTRETSVSMRS